MNTKENQFREQFVQKIQSDLESLLGLYLGLFSDDPRSLDYINSLIEKYS